MVQIAGTYKLEKNENFADYLKALGVSDEIVKKADAPGFVTDVIVEGDKYIFKSSSKIETTFVLNEEFDEPLPVGITLKSVAKLEGNKITITSKAEDGRTGTRVYEFTDSGYTATFAYKDIVAKRFFVRA